jgi:hypothetical protein
VLSEESITPDRVELVRHTFEAFSGGDLDAVTSAFAPDPELKSIGLGTSFQGVVTCIVSSADTPEARAAGDRLAEKRG